MKQPPDVSLHANDLSAFIGPTRGSLDGIPAVIELWEGNHPRRFTVRRALFEYRNGGRTLVLVAGDEINDEE